MSVLHRDAILKRVSDAGCDFKHDVHEPVTTSQHASDIRGVPLSSGAKAIIVRGRKTGRHTMFVLPADRRLDTKVAVSLVGEKISFAADVERDFDCVPGSVPPFGSVLGLQTYADEALEDVLNFNIGLITESMQLSKKDYLALEKPTLARFSEKVIT